MLIEHATDRTPYICQAQSINIFIPADIDKKDLNRLHYLAWKKGIKSLCYCRSKSLQRADKVSISDGVEKHQLEMKLSPVITKEDNKYDECLACQ